MYKNLKILALIPARSGSKGLVGKNIRPLLGKPLIAWTVEEALASKYLDRVIVSTDSLEISKISESYGAEVPFLRPKELATDDAKMMAVVQHALDWLEQQEGQRYDLLVLLQPTSPLRAAEDIDRAIEELLLKKAKAIISVCEVDHHPYWANTLPPEGSMKNFIKPEIMDMNRQELPKFYRLNGAVYIAYLDYLKKTGGFLGKETFAYVMPRERSIDIDSAIDFKLAESMMKEKITD